MGEARRRRQRGEPPRTTEVEKIEPSDLRYLVRVRQNLQQIPQIDAQIEELQRMRMSILGAHDSYGVFLAERYGLDFERDHVDEKDGVITRVPQQGNVVPIQSLVESGSQSDE